jgi:hypothetical protein
MTKYFGQIPTNVTKAGNINDVKLARAMITSQFKRIYLCSNLITRSLTLASCWEDVMSFDEWLSELPFPPIVFGGYTQLGIQASFG